MLFGRKKMGSKINNILYATDLSENSGHVFQYALEAARRHGARLHILHVFAGLTPASEAALSVSLPNFREIRKNNMREMAAIMEDELKGTNGNDPGPCIATMLVAEGEPVREILKAEKWNCEIIVMGTHGRGLTTTLFGSVSEKVLHHTSRPVYIIPIPKGGNRTSYPQV
jgi:nucleotide-binding universal stress UspA family protein